MQAPRTIRLDVNGTVHQLDIPPGASLLHVLRNDLQLNGPKYGCGLGQCGACTVLIDGKAARSCVLPAANLEGFAIVTLEGLGSRDRLHPVQRAFIARNATQCGYCLNGIIMTVAALVARVPGATEAEIKEALRYNLCRCGSHVEVLEAACDVAAEMAAGAVP